MWEQIRANKRRSVILVTMMALVLLGLGFVIGEASQPGAGLIGLAIAFVVWSIMALVSYYSGGDILLAFSGARKVSREDNPRLYNVVEEMQIAAGLKKTPDIYIIDTMAPNAFATGRDPDHAAVAVTAGLLAKLNRDQLQGVIAHEIGHVRNRDILFMTLLSVMLGAIVLISEVFLRKLFYFGAGRRSRSSNGGNQLQIIMILVAIVFAILAPVLGQIIYFAASRRREYLADASAAVFTRYPEGLASALEIIAGSPNEPIPGASHATAPLYINNPLSRGAVGLFSTHPPIEQRIAILRGMGRSGEASFKAYQGAYGRVTHRASNVIPQSALGLAAVPLRGAAASDDAQQGQAHAPAAPSPRTAMREAYDTVRKANRYAFINCECGLRIKLPPTYRNPSVTCPRCGTLHVVRKP